MTAKQTFSFVTPNADEWWDRLKKDFEITNQTTVLVSCKPIDHFLTHSTLFANSISEGDSYLYRRGDEVLFVCYDPDKDILVLTHWHGGKEIFNGAQS